MEQHRKEQQEVLSSVYRLISKLDKRAEILEDKSEILFEIIMVESISNLFSECGRITKSISNKLKEKIK